MSQHLQAKKPELPQDKLLGPLQCPLGKFLRLSPSLMEQLLVIFVNGKIRSLVESQIALIRCMILIVDT